MDDLQGWQQTRWEMTEAEIIKVVGLDVIRRMPRENGKDWYSELIIQNVPIGNFSFDVTFQMGENTHLLQQVFIRHSAIPGRPPKNEMEVAMRILSEKFGASERVGTSGSSKWSFPTTTIFLDEFFIEDIASDVFIRFLPTARCTRELAAF